jgi:hypothetical protein
MNIEPKKVFIPVSVQDELPDIKNCYHVEWHHENNPPILGACIYEWYNKGEFDVSDDDDIDPTNPRSIQPTHWFKEQNLYCFTKEELIKLLNDYEQKLCVIPMSGEEYIEQLNIK